MNFVMKYHSSILILKNDSTRKNLQLTERSHGVSRSQLHCDVDIFGSSIAPLDQADGFKQVRHKKAVDDESWRERENCQKKKLKLKLQSIFS